jgi:hypothetical protein
VGNPLLCDDLPGMRPGATCEDRCDSNGCNRTWAALVHDKDGKVKALCAFHARQLLEQRKRDDPHYAPLF